MFQAGTALRDGRLMTNGGRILNVTAGGDDVASARERAYAAAVLISFEGMQLRNDIAQDFARVDVPLVGILVGSESDRARMQAAMDELDARGIAWEFDVRSAHRAPKACASTASSPARRGSGRSPAPAWPRLSRASARRTRSCRSSACRSARRSASSTGSTRCSRSSRCRRECPVATVGVDNAKNAAVLAARILALL